MPNFEVLDARIASALNKIIHNSHFKRRISREEQKAQKQDRFLRGRQIAYLIYDYFRVTGSHDSVENYADLFTISLRNDDIQEFDSKFDGILLSMTPIPSDDILERLPHKRSEPFFFFFKMTQRIELFFSKCDSKTWTFFWKMWLKELNFFFKCDSKNWTSFWIWFKELNFCQICTTQSQRIEPPFFQYDSTNRTPFFCMWLMFSYVLKNRFFIWLKEWYLTQRLEIYVFEIWFKELFFYDDSQTWSFFSKKYDAKNFFLKNMSQRIEPFFVWLKELNPFLYDSKNWTLFVWRKRIEPVCFEYDAENWTFFLICRKELSFFFFAKFWLKELSHFFLNRTERIELFYMTYRIEPLLFALIWFKEFEPCVKKNDSKNRNLFFLRK